MTVTYPLRKFSQLATSNVQTVVPGTLSTEVYSLATTGPLVEMWAGPAGDDTNNGLTYNTRKKTLLGAYDALPATGGTIYVEDGTYVGGTVANQGIWLMSTVDPNYGLAGYPGGTNPTLNGWRSLKNVKWQGIGGRSGVFIKEPVSIVFGGQPGQNWAADPNKPAIWISDGNGTPQSFKNLAIEGAYRSVVLGRPSDRSNAVDPFVANIEFDCCEIATQGTNVSGVGPTVETGMCIFCSFTRCCISSWGSNGIAYAPHSITAEEAGACILTKPQAGNVGGYVLRDCVFVYGGILFEVGNTGWGLIVDNLLVEGDWVHFIPPPVKITDITVVGAAVIKNIGISDAGGDPVCVEITPAWADKSIVRTENASTVIGPHTAIDNLDPGYYGHSNVVSPVAYGGIGIWEDRIVARHDGIGRAGSPTVARYENLIDPSDFFLGTGCVLASGIDDPWGGSSARRLTVSGGYSSAYAGIRNDYTQSYSIGDRVVIASWLRHPLGTNRVSPGMMYSTSPSNLFATAGGGATTSSGGYYFGLQANIVGADYWRWEVEGHKLTTCGAPISTCQISAWVASGEQTDFVSPLLQIIPSGEMTDNEFSEYLLHLNSIPELAQPGVSYTPPGVNQSIDGNLETAGVIRSYSDIESDGDLLVTGTVVSPRVYCTSSGGYLFYPQPDDNGLNVSWIQAPSPCPISNTELIDQGWDSMTVSPVTDGALWYFDEISGNLVDKINGYELVSSDRGDGYLTQHADFISGTPHARKYCITTTTNKMAATYDDAAHLMVGTQDFSVSMLLRGTTTLSSSLWWSRGWIDGGAGGWGIGTLSGDVVGLLLRETTNQYWHVTDITLNDSAIHLVTVSVDRDGLVSFYVDRQVTQTVVAQIPGTLELSHPFDSMWLPGMASQSNRSCIGKIAWAAMWVGKAIGRRGHDDLVRALRIP
jgi:hypothetical protein